MGLAERFFGKLAGAAGDGVEHVDDRIDVFADGEIGAHRFLRATHQAIGGVDIELEDIGHIGGDAATRKPGYVRQRIDETGEVRQILQCRWPVEVCIQVERLYRGATGAEVNAVSADLEAVIFVAAVKNEGLAGAVDDVFDHISRKTESSQVVQAGAAF
jgi:hypothetical protein